MSIKENPNTILEKVDKAANLVEQMFIAHKVNDETRFEEAHKEARNLLHDVTFKLDNS